MVYGTDEIGVRGSTCESVTIVGAGAPGGVSGPWADALSIANKIAHRTHRLVTSRLLISLLTPFLGLLTPFLGDGLRRRVGSEQQFRRWVGWQNGKARGTTPRCVSLRR